MPFFVPNVNHVFCRIIHKENCYLAIVILFQKDWKIEYYLVPIPSSVEYKSVQLFLR